MHQLHPHFRAWLDRQLATVTILQTTGPAAADLAAAPRLDPWQAVLLDTSGIPALWGEVTGHPKLGDTVILTSRLLALDAANGWARTTSRWYRLGQPFAAQLQDLARQIEARDGAAPGSITMGFQMPGCRVVTDPGELEPVFTRYIAWMRQLDAGDRAARGMKEH